LAGEEATRRLQLYKYLSNWKVASAASETKAPAAAETKAPAAAGGPGQ
jgi:hypothetical protein